MGRLRAAALRMRRLIQDLGLYSRVAQQDMAGDDVDLADVARKAAAALAPEVEAAGATLDIDADALPHVQGDAGMLRRMAELLLQNALAFARPDAAPHVRVTGTEEGEAPGFVVEDNGIGIDPKHVERIFQPFERLHADGNDDRTGMGLALVRLVAERHGGQVHVAPSGSGGTRFVVTLPASPDASPGA